MHASRPMTRPGDAPQPARWRGPESNWRHHDFQSCALPTELPRRVATRWYLPFGDLMDAHANHDMDVNQMALSATLHCLTGCAIGEIVGVIVGTALGWSNEATIVLAIVLAFVFGYSLTSWPLLRAGLALATVIPIAFASDTLSIAVMELVDNAIIVVIPGAMDAGLDDVLFWGSLSFALFIAGFFAYPVNRWLLQGGKGHAAVHATGIHGGPSPAVVGVIAAAAGLFGTVVLIADAVG